ncbi:MAG: P-II family nitrogen regulator [Bacillota bacterium]
MKEVMIIVRMNMINKTKEALALAGFPAFNCMKVAGRGKKKVDYELIELLLDGQQLDSVNKAEVISEQHRLIPKRLISIVANDDDVKKIIDMVIEVNQTGNMGDGKIFVVPVEEVIRVRTGERGSEAI